MIQFFKVYVTIQKIIHLYHNLVIYCRRKLWETAPTSPSLLDHASQREPIDKGIVHLSNESMSHFHSTRKLKPCIKDCPF